LIDLSVIIVSYNSYHYLEKCLASFFCKVTGITSEVILVNNNCEDKSLAGLAEKYHVILINNRENCGFGKACNIGLGLARGKYILFVNPDVVFLTNIKRLIDILNTDSTIGAIGPLIHTGDQRIQTSVGELPNMLNWFSYNLMINHILPKSSLFGNYPRFNFKYDRSCEVGWITGAFMLGSKEVFNSIAGFDESFFMFSEDLDFCWRLRRRGYKIVFSNEAEIIHEEGHAAKAYSERRAGMYVESLIILWEKHFSQRKVVYFVLVYLIGSWVRKLIWLIKNSSFMVSYYDFVMKYCLRYLRNERKE
jgi:GT2 family glycosyltransferase